MELQQGQSWEVPLSPPCSGPMWGHADEMEERGYPGTCVSPQQGDGDTSHGSRNTVPCKSTSRLLISSEDLLGLNLCSITNAKTCP